MEAILDCSFRREKVQEVQRGMSMSVKSHARMSDSMCRCIYVCMEAYLCVCFYESAAMGFYLKSGPSGPRETSKDWMIDAGQSLSLMNGLHYVSN